MSWQRVRETMAQQLSRRLRDGDAIEAALREGARLAIEEHAKEGDVAAQHLAAVAELDQVKAELEQVKAERDALAAEVGAVEAAKATP